MDNGESWDKMLVCSRLFEALQYTESFLRGGLCMTITRSGDYVVSCKVYACGDSTALLRYKVRAKDVTNEKALQDEMDGLWSELVAKKLVDCGSNDGKEQS